jgi:Ca2+-binding EF-hand superfamily protein
MTAAFAGHNLKEADTDNNGLISLAEFKATHEARIEEHFARLDTDADGYISEEEMQAAPRRPRDMKGNRRHHKEMNPEKAVERLDADGSGGVSQQELEGKRFSPDSETFFAADTDGSGELSAAELHAMMEARWAEHRGAERGRKD